MTKEFNQKILVNFTATNLFGTKLNTAYMSTCNKELNEEDFLIIASKLQNDFRFSKIRIENIIPLPLKLTDPKTV